jgi:signal transduction histidine kinase
MPPVAALPLQIALALLVFSVLGTLGGIWISIVVLRQVGMRRLTGMITALPEAPAPDDDDFFGLPGTGNVSRGLLQLIATRTQCSFAVLFLPKYGDDCMTAVTVEGGDGPWQSAELAYMNPVMRRMVTEGLPIELRGIEDDLNLPAGTVLFPVLSRNHLIATIAVGPRSSEQPISTRDRRFVAESVHRASAPLENAQLYRSLRRAFTEVENAQRELLALQRVSVAAQSTLRLEEVLAQIAQGVVDGLSFDLAVVYLADPANSIISLPISSRESGQREASDATIVIDEANPTMRALSSNEVLVTHDLGESLLPSLMDAGVLNKDEIPPNSTIANLPLASKARSIGGMALTTRRPALSGAEIESLRSFAAQAAATIENARLYEELETAYRDLGSAQDQLIQTARLRTLGQVASGVAHDFNNILAAILARAQIAQEQTRSAGVRQSLKIIEQAALDGANAARRIQRLGRPQEESAAERVNLNEVAQQALDLTRPMWSNAARARGVSIATDVSLTPDAFVEGQASELREVMTNLILNATAAMPAGGRLGIRTERERGQICCTVEDTGTGMTDEVRSRVFDPFFTTKGEAGSGLGLSIVGAILERHRGTISIDTAPGKGTSVQFSLPAVASETQAAASRRRRGRVSLRILLAAEGQEARESLEGILKRYGHRVCESSTVEESIRLLGEQEFDVIVTELALGEHSGWEVAEAAKAIRPSAAVVLATAWVDQWDPEVMRDRGVDAVLAKPYTVDEVLSCLEQALVKSS